MIKTIAAGTVALTLAGAGLALAQQTPPRDAPRWRPSTEDVAALTDARIAGLKAGLKLTAEQEKHWPAVEAAMRDLARKRADRMKELADRRADRREARQRDNAAAAPDLIGRLHRRADVLSERATGLKTFADAAAPLYQSLDEGQKRRFGLMLRMGAQARHGFWRWQHRADNAR